MSIRDNGIKSGIQALVMQLGDDRLKARLEAALSGQAAVADKNAGGIRQEVLDGREAARVLGTTVRTIRNWAQAGLIKRVCLPGARRAFGYSRASIEALAAGEAEAAS